MSTDPEFLWLGEKHTEALAVLKYAIMENKGVLALTGDVGTGKTTLINALLKSLGKDTITATIYDARLEVLDFFNTVAAAFKIKGTFDGKGKFLLRFMDFLIKTHERNQKVLLIIDEAQGISANLLEEIRLLSNLEAEYTRLLNIFFVGQNEFIDILQKYENRALRQRVTIRYHIDPLTLNETAAYIRHRLEVSGTTAPIFDSGAIDEIYFFSGGYPRLINIMCDHALLTGYVREVRTINANHIRECREELLVSKKAPDKNFEFPDGNQQVLYREPMAFEPSRESMASEPSGEPMASEPSKAYTDSAPSAEPMAPDLSEEIMDYVNDSSPIEDTPDRFRPHFPMYGPTNPVKSQKKRFFSLRSIMIFLLVAGAGTGYYFHTIRHNRTSYLVKTTPPPIKERFSIDSESKIDNPAMAQAGTDASGISKQVPSDKPGESRFSGIDSSNSGISKAPVPKEIESIKPGPSKRFSQDAEAALLSKKSEKSESADNIQTAETDHNLTSKTEQASFPSEKPPEKIHASDQTSAEIPASSSAVAAGPENPPAKAPVVIPAPTIEKETGRVAASEPVQIHTAPKDTRTAGKAVVNNATGMPETAEPVTRSGPEQNKAKAPKIASAAPSDVSSKKQATALFEKFKKDLSKKTAGSEAKIPTRPLSTVKGKTPTPGSISDQKKLISQKAAGRPNQGTGEKIASLSSSANTSEKTGKTQLTYVPLITRLESFLKNYCRTYEQKDLDKFSDFFAFNAVEKGKPFKSWRSTYRRNFKRIDAIEYNIDLNRYATQEETGLVKIDGTFHIRARLEGSKEWLKSTGDISMILEADGNSFKVKELDY